MQKTMFVSKASSGHTDLWVTGATLYPKGPQVVSFTGIDPLLGKASAVHYALTFSEPVTGVNAGDFSLVTTGVSGASIVSVTPVAGGNGSQYIITVDTGTGDGTVALDLSGAGIQDLAGNPMPGGTFQAHTDYATGTNPHSLANGDLNGDGKLDAVTADNGGNTVSVLLGNGNGTFQTKTSYATGALPISVAIGDLNGDGRPDLAVANNNSNTVSVLLGSGEGTFQNQTTYDTGT